MFAMSAGFFFPFKPYDLLDGGWMSEDLWIRVVCSVLIEQMGSKDDREST